MKQRTFYLQVLLGLLLALVSNFIITGGAIITARVFQISGVISHSLNTISNKGILYTERILNSVEKQIRILSFAAIDADQKQRIFLMRQALYDNHLADAIYYLEPEGHVVEIAQIVTSFIHEQEVKGNDFSNLPFYQSAKDSELIVWSEKFISPLTGEATIGVAFQHSGYVTIAEISIPRLIEDLRDLVTDTYTEAWIFDRQGNLLADTEEDSGGIIDTAGKMLLTSDARTWKSAIPGFYTWHNQRLQLGSAVSEKLGWRIVARSPSFLNNPLITTTIKDVLLLISISLIVAAIFTMLTLRRQSSAIKGLIDLSRKVVKGDQNLVWPVSNIREYNELSLALKTMLDKVRDRERTLINLNEQLEERVERRTGELASRNAELSQMLQTLRKTQEELIQSEKMASLGRLVAGVAHELNTPLGNSIMAISTVSHKTGDFSKSIEAGITKGELSSYLEDTQKGLQIAQRNLERTAELLTSFKQVANDQSSNLRRRFLLDQMLTELLQTLHPTLKRMPHALETDLNEGIYMDSYPGVLGQIMTNLINNAITHAWKEGEKGTLRLETKRREDQVIIKVIDNGSGIDDSIKRRVFDPFFTTNRDAGGTGLGLRIARNGAENILGGSLSFTSSTGGTTFTLSIPVNAPVIEIERDY